MHFPRCRRSLAGTGGGVKAQGGKAQGREVFVYSGVALQKWRIAQRSLAIMRGSWDIARGRLGQPQRKSGNRAGRGMGGRRRTGRRVKRVVLTMQKEVASRSSRSFAFALGRYKPLPVSQKNKNTRETFVCSRKIW